MNYLRTLVLVILFLTACNRDPAAFTNKIVETRTPTATSPVVSYSPTAPISMVSPTTTGFATSAPGVTSTSIMTHSLSTATPLVDQIFKFEGKVSRNQMFEQPISQDIYFRLWPISHGWEIWIGKKAQPYDSYVAVVTPPYHGMNARFIEGWHFRNSDNTGPNEPGEKLVNAPQKERRFSFILSEKDFQIAYAALSPELLPSEKEREQVLAAAEKLEPYDGKLTITGLKLGNLVLGEKAWIESMDFEIELSLPPSFK